MPHLRHQFGRNLRRVRLKKDWTQEVAAERLGLSLNFYNAMERGTKSPSFDNLELIGEVFRIPVCQLFEYSDEAVGERVSRATHGKKSS